MAETIRRGMLFGGAATGIFVFGIVMAVLGTLFGLPEMRARLQIDMAQQGNVFLLLFMGILVSTLVAGPAIDSIGNKIILVASSALVAAGMAGLAPQQRRIAGVIRTLAAQLQRVRSFRQRLEHQVISIRRDRLNMAGDVLIEENLIDVELAGNFLWNWRAMHSLAGRSDRRTFRDWAAVADVCGFCRSVRSTVSRDALSRVERPAELFMARGAAGGPVSGRAGAGIFVVLPIGK